MRYKLLVIFFLNLYMLNSCLFAKEEVKIKKENIIYIKEIIVEGLESPEDKEDINNIIKPYINSSLSFKDFKIIRSKINSYYKNKGKLFTKVVLPAQKLKDSILKFLVVKGKVGKINVTGNKHFSKEFIEDNLVLKEGELLDYSLLIKSLLLLNEYENLEVKSFFKKGSKLGESNINLNVKDSKPFSINVSLDNFGSDDTSKYRVSTNLFYGNLLSDGEEIYLNTSVGVQSANTTLAKLEYRSKPIGKYHTKLNLSYLFADYVVVGDFEVLELQGDTKIYNFGVKQPILRSQTNTLDVGLNYYNKVMTNYLLGEISSIDEFSTLEFSSSFAHKSVFDSYNLYFNITKGFSGDDSLGSRLNQVIDLQKINLGGSYNIYFNATNSMQFILNAQYAAERLPLAEMFILGGLSSVRGFPSAEKLGDYGFSTSLEYFYHPKFENDWLKDSAKIGLFVDYGQAFAIEAIPGESESVSLMGAGVELILNMKKKYFSKLTLATPISSSSADSTKELQLYAYFGIKF